MKNWVNTGRGVLLIGWLAALLTGCLDRETADNSLPAGGSPPQTLEATATPQAVAEKQSGAAPSAEKTSLPGEQKAPERCQPSESGLDTSAYIGVNVATLWASPGKARAVDLPAGQFPAQPEKWVKAMNPQEKLWLVGELETQALFGEQVVVLEEKGDWAKVAVVDQRTSRSEQGYPGWLPKRQLINGGMYSRYEHCEKAVVAKMTTPLLRGPDNPSDPLMTVSFNTRLPIMEVVDDYVEVMTPQAGSKWLKLSDVKLESSDSPAVAVTGEMLVETGKQFLGLPYLWGGVSGFGFDCSGFTSAIYGFYDIAIPRDSEDQAKGGRPVSLDELKPGDLLFYAYENGKGQVHHVAMYAGDGRILHSPDTDRSVEMIPLGTEVYMKEFAGARRYLP